MAAQLTPDDLARFIEHNGITAQLIREVGDTPTVPAAANALGVEPEQIIKTLLFLIRHPGEPAATVRPAIVISNGESRVSKKALAAYFGVSNKRVKLAQAAVVLELLGYPAGGVPPFGHRNSYPIILDQSILDLPAAERDCIFAGGGDDRTMMQLTVSELLRVTQPTIRSVSE